VTDPSYRSVTSRRPPLIRHNNNTESPRFLAENGLLSSAEDALSWLRALPREHPDILEEVEELREDSQALEMLDTPKRSFFHELRDKSVRKRLFVRVGLMVAQNVVGLNALNYCEFSFKIWLLFYATC
jgi:hypothetical protein